MPYFLLVCAVISVLLLGGTSTEDRQARAEKVFDAATEEILQGVEAAKNLGEKAQASAEELQERGQKLQGGVEKVMDAASELKEGTKEVRGALGVQ